MVIYLVQHDGRGELPKRHMRWDVAWELMLPDTIGDVPAGFRGAQATESLTAWAWRKLGAWGGRVVAKDPEPIWFIVPPLTPEAREYVVRIASFWADEVYEVTDLSGENRSENLWLFPVVDMNQDDPAGSLGARLSERDAAFAMRFFSVHMGYGRAVMGLDVIEAGGVKGRLHSHSAVDEYYVVLSGRGTLRMGPHTMPVGPGTLIGKPTGPDLTSHIVADKGEAIKILDMEVWPEAGYRAKDVVHYQDIGEVYLRGAGWDVMTSTESLLPTADLRQHYDDGYVRHADGTWSPKEVPGVLTRQKD